MSNVAGENGMVQSQRPNEPLSIIEEDIHVLIVRLRAVKPVYFWYLVKLVCQIYGKIMLAFSRFCSFNKVAIRPWSTNPKIVCYPARLLFL